MKACLKKNMQKMPEAEVHELFDILSKKLNKDSKITLILTVLESLDLI